MRQGGASGAWRRAAGVGGILRNFSGNASALQACGDVVVAQGCVLTALLIRILMVPWLPISVGPSVFVGIQLAAFLLPFGFYAVSLYPGYGFTPVERLRRRAIVIMVTFGLCSLFDYLALGGQWSRGILLVAAAMAVVVLPTCNGLLCLMLDRLGWWGEPVAIYGDDERAERVRSALKANSALGWRPMEVMDWPPPEDPPAGVNLAILVPPQDADLPSLLDRVNFRRVVIVPDLGSIQSQWVAARDTGIGPGLELRRNLLSPLSQYIKRAVDLMALLVLTPIAIPVVLIFALAVIFCSPGNPFYAQLRIGRNNEPLRLWKIRSMVLNADEVLSSLLENSDEHRVQWATYMKLKKDPRLLPFLGKFMRRWSIDELPQIYNVLKGEMSLVGPRPLPAYHIEAITPADAALRTRILPGITGLAQISGRSAQTIEAQATIDTYYIRNWSMWLDYYILMRTIGRVLSGKGAY